MDFLLLQVFPTVLRNTAVGGGGGVQYLLFFNQLTKIKWVKLPIWAISVFLLSDSSCFITDFFFFFIEIIIKKSRHMASISYSAIVNADQWSLSQRKGKIYRRNKWLWPSFTSTLFDPWGPGAEGFHEKVLPASRCILAPVLFIVLLLTKDVISAHPITWHQSGNTDGEKENSTVWLYNGWLWWSWQGPISSAIVAGVIKKY